MPAREIIIINKLGLHARAAAKFVRVASLYKSDVRLGRSADALIDGKSIMAVMMLAAGQGASLYLQTQGEDADDALEALVQLINNRFDESQ